MNVYENIKKNLKESSKEELVNSLINYLYDTYGDNFKLEDNVNGYTKNEEIYETLVTQYLEEKPDISFVEWVKDIIADPHGLLEVKSLNEAENNNAAYVICYGTLEIWPDRDSAREYYEEGIAMSDGAEQQRYGNIAFALYKGNNFGDDEGPEMVTKIVDKNADGSDKSAGTKCGKMTHEQAFNYITKLQGSINESEAPQTYERGNAPFESKRVPEDRIREEGYQYFSTHGVGPGTHPRDVRVRELDIELPGGWVTFKTDRPLTSEELDWYDIQPETKNSYYRQRFGLEEADNINVSEEIPNDLKVETCEAEQTGGWIWVAYGKMADGRYYCLFDEGISFFDDDIHKYEYEEDHWDETQGDFSDWEDEHRIKTDSNKYYAYWYTDPEYLIMLKQCIALDPNAEYIADEDELAQMGIDKLYEAELQSLFTIITDEARKHNNYAHLSAREIDSQDIKELTKECKKQGKEIAPGKYVVDDYIYEIDSRAGITVKENTDAKYKVVPVKDKIQ